MSGDGGTVKKTNHLGFDYGSYTPIKVKDKDSGKQFTINFKNAKVTGNEASWTIKDGVLCDKNGKPIKDNVMEVTRYQAAIIKAADSDGDSFIDEDDYTGGGFAYDITEELQEAKSEFKVPEYTYGYTYGKDGELVPLKTYDAEASNGRFTAFVENSKGEKGKLIIDIRTEEDLQREAQRKAEQQKSIEDANKPWWKFW